MSLWISPAASTAVAPFRTCHDCAGLSSPAVKNVMRSSSANAPRRTRTRPGSPPPISPRIASASAASSSPSSDSSLALTATTAAPLGARVLLDLGGDLVAALVDVHDEEDRLRREWAQLAQRIRGGLRRRDGADGHAPAEGVDHRREPLLLGDGGLLSTSRQADHALEPSLGLLQVGEQQLGLDRLDVGEGRHAALGMHDVRVVVRAYDVDQRVRLADVREEAVAEPLAAVRAGDQAGDVVEGDGVVDDLGRPDDLGDRHQAIVGHGDDRDVGLDRRKRVVRRLGAGVGERVEERRLPGVREADDADLHGIRRETKVPSATPAAESDG